MGIFGIDSAGEAYCHAMAIMCGISMMLPVNAVFSAPLYIMHYYQYVMKEPGAEGKYTNFWNNVMTYYTLVNFVVSLIVEPLTLTKRFRKISLYVRMLSSLFILWMEIVLLIVVPAVGASEEVAVATLMIAGVMSGSGKSVFEATSYGLFSAFPSHYITFLMGGVGVAGALTSVVQIIVKLSFPEDYNGLRTQSEVFYGLMLGIQVITFIMLILLRWNSYAKRYTDALFNTESKEKDENKHPEKDENTPLENGAERATIDEKNTHTAENLSKAHVFNVLKIVYPMLIACAFNFFVTLMLFPTMIISVDPEDYWFGTIAVFIFNICDVFGRFAPSFHFLWPPRWAVIAGSFARSLFVPLIVLASYHYIPTHAFTYVMMVLFGLSNGFIGTLTLVLGPLTKGLTSGSQHFIAGTMLGISILVGGSIGTVLSIMVQTLREKDES